MINYAHRGASHYAPENTFAAFDLGIAQKANGIETDIQQTQDGVLVLHHDKTLGRLTGIDRPVQDLTYAELQALDFGQWFDPRFAGERIVPFEAFWQRYSQLPLHFALEIKQPGIEAALLQAIGHYNPSRVILTSFDIQALETTRALDKAIPLGYLTEHITQPTLDHLKTHRIRQICPRATTLTPAAVTLAKAQGFSVRAWGIKDEATMHHALACAVDGMTVNFPDLLEGVVRGAHGAPPQTPPGE